MRVDGKTHCHPHSRPGLGILPAERPRQLDPARAAPEIALVLALDGVEMQSELGNHDGGQRGGPIFVALAGTNRDLVAREVHVLHPEAQGLEETEPSSVQQGGDETVGASELSEDGADLVARQYHGQANGPLGTHDVVEPRQVLLQHISVEEEQRAQGLVLGGGGDLSVHGQRAEELRHLGAAHPEGMALVVKEDVPAGPRDVGLLGAPTVVAGAHRRTHAVEQAGLRRPGRPRLACDQRVGTPISRLVDNRSDRAHKGQWHPSFWRGRAGTIAGRCGEGKEPPGLSHL
jgi:hypothetical protein